MKYILLLISVFASTVCFSQEALSTENGKIIVDILQSQDQAHIDELYFKSKLSSSSVAQALLMLEMQGVVASLPGKVYKMYA